MLVAAQPGNKSYLDAVVGDIHRSDNPDDGQHSHHEDVSRHAPLQCERPCPAMPVAEPWLSVSMSIRVGAAWSCGSNISGRLTGQIFICLNLLAAAARKSARGPIAPEPPLQPQCAGRQTMASA
ncbi:protein of unknown function [Burkholderia multivorans]